MRIHEATCPQALRPPCQCHRAAQGGQGAHSPHTGNTTGGHLQLHQPVQPGKRPTLDPPDPVPAQDPEQGGGGERGCSGASRTICSITWHSGCSARGTSLGCPQPHRAQLYLSPWETYSHRTQGHPGRGLGITRVNSFPLAAPGRLREGPQHSTAQPSSSTGPGQGGGKQSHSGFDTQSQLTKFMALLRDIFRGFGCQQKALGWP